MKLILPLLFVLLAWLPAAAQTAQPDPLTIFSIEASPNPFSNFLIIKISRSDVSENADSLSASAQAIRLKRVDILNQDGAHVASITTVPGEEVAAKVFLHWDGLNDQGLPVPNGTYDIRIAVPESQTMARVRCLRDR